MRRRMRREKSPFEGKSTKKGGDRSPLVRQTGYRQVTLHKRQARTAHAFWRGPLRRSFPCVRMFGGIRLVRNKDLKSKHLQKRTGNVISVRVDGRVPLGGADARGVFLRYCQCRNFVGLRVKLTGQRYEKVSTEARESPAFFMDGPIRILST